MPNTATILDPLASGHNVMTSFSLDEYEFELFPESKKLVTEPLLKLVAQLHSPLVDVDVQSLSVISTLDCA